MKRKMYSFCVVALGLFLGAGIANAGLLNDSVGTAALWQMEEWSGADLNKINDDDSVVDGRNNKLIMQTTVPALVPGYEGNALVLNGVDQYGMTGTALSLTNYVSVTTYVKFDLPVASIPTNGEYIISCGQQFNLERVPGGKIWWAALGKIKGGVMSENIWYKLEASLTRQGSTNFADATLTVTDLSSNYSYTVTGVLDISSWSTPANIAVGRYSDASLGYFDGMVDATQIVVIPEPATITMLGMGLFSMLLKRKKG